MIVLKISKKLGDVRFEKWQHRCQFLYGLSDGLVLESDRHRWEWIGGGDVRFGRGPNRRILKLNCVRFQKNNNKASKSSICF